MKIQNTQTDNKGSKESVNYQFLCSFIKPKSYSKLLGMAHSFWNILYMCMYTDSIFCKCCLCIRYKTAHSKKCYEFSLHVKYVCTIYKILFALTASETQPTKGVSIYMFRANRNNNKKRPTNPLLSLTFIETIKLSY